MENLNDAWKIIFTSHSGVEVQSAKNYLESEGIQTFLQNELAAQIYGNTADKPKILVKEVSFARKGLSFSMCNVPAFFPND